MTQQATVLNEGTARSGDAGRGVRRGQFEQMRRATAVAGSGRVGETARGIDEVDRALVDRVVAGDNKAFDELVCKYQSRLMAVLRRYARDPADALDIAQIAFLKAYRAIASFRGDCSFYGWLCRIGINCANSYLVSRARHSGLADDLDDAERYGQHPQLEDHRTPERHLLAAEATDAVMNVMDGLPPHLRLAAMLRDVDGLSYEEIARIADCPLGTVRSRIFRARQAAKEGFELAMGTAM